MRVLLFLFLTSMLVSCDSDRSKDTVLNLLKSEQIVTFSVNQDSLGESVRGDIIHAEKSNFDSLQQETHKSFFDQKLRLIGVERYRFGNTSKYPSESFYENPKGLVMSRYVHGYDINGNREVTYAYDHKDELLRIERFAYNEEGQKIRKEIRDSKDNASRIFEIGLDSAGIEILITVKSPTNSIVHQESFKVTKRDDNGEWVEKWGFIGEEPSSVIERTLEYY